MVLIIKPISAQLVYDSDFFGKGDPYCIIMIGSQKQRTKTHNGGGKSPQWYDTLQFNNYDSLMKVALYDDDWGKDDFIGEGQININQLYSNPQRTENLYVDILHHGKSAGRVLISIEYQGSPMGQQQGVITQPLNQTGWGNQPPNQGGWGNQPPNQAGWGNQPPNQGGWGNQPPNQGGWGNQPPNQGGWGNKPPNQGGWGILPSNPGGYGYGGNNGWF